MAINYVRREFERIMISSLRTFFSTDEEFPYLDDDLATSIIITPVMPIIDVENKLPHIILTSISYGFSQQFISSNLANVENDATSIQVYTYTNLVPFNAMIACLSTNKAEAESLADKVVAHLSFLNHETFLTLGLFIDDVQTGPADFKTQYPQFEFACGVNMQGRLKYNWVVRNSDPNILIAKIQNMMSTY